MRLGLTGMSGVGKTYWATRLAEAGFTCFHCDDLIAARLQSKLGLPIFTLSDIGKWMGFPDAAAYREKEQVYLSYEAMVLREVMTQLEEQVVSQQPLVVDFTGSVIYMEPDLLTLLNQRLHIVYLTITSDRREQMIQAFLNEPRPLIWQNFFSPDEGEPLPDALTRCYEPLLTFREEQYEAFSHIQLDYHVHRQPGLAIDSFLKRITAANQS